MRVSILLMALALVGACRSPYYKVPLAAPQVYLEGEKALAQGEYARAAHQFTAYIDSGRDSYRARSYYQLARARYQMEDYHGAAVGLDNLDREYPEFGRKQTAALRGDVAYAMGHRSDAILLWEEAYSHSSPTEQETLKPRISNAMHVLSVNEVNDLARELTEPAIYAMAIDRLAGPAPGEAGALPEDMAPGEDMAPSAAATLAAADLAANPEGAVGTGVAATTAPGASPPHTEAAAATDRGADEVAVATDAPSAGDSQHYIGISRSRVACLLPLTGPRREEGQFALRAVRRSFDESTLVIRDSGGGPAEVRAIVRELAADDDVVAMFGPMHPETISAALAQAKQAGLPMLALPVIGAGHTVDHRQTALATYAVRNLGARRIGIVAPNSARPTAFETSAAALGAAIVGTYRYGADESYASGTLAAVQRWVDAGGVDAVYIPGRAAEATEIAAVARAVAPEIILLGNQGWNNQAVLADSGTSVEGAIIVGNTAPNSVEAEIAASAEALRKVTKPGASGRDDARTLLASIDTTRVESPTLLRIVAGRATAIQP